MTATPDQGLGRQSNAFRLGDVEIRPASNELLVDGTVLRVKPRLMEVLLRLAAEPGAVVSREVLLHDVWPRRMVNDEVLSRVIADLRAVLRDDAREARFIETIPKVGYRLIAPVVPLAADAVAAPAAPSPAAAPAAAPAIAPALPTPPVTSGRRWWWAAGLACVVALGAALLARPGDDATDRAMLERQLAQAEPFTSADALEVGPRYSADGRRIAYALGEGARAVVEIRTIGSPERFALGDPADLNLNPVFYPDGQRVAYFRRGRDGQCGIVAQDVQGGGTRPLVDCLRDLRAQFDLAADGRHLVYVAVTRPQFPAGLVLRDLDTGLDRTLTTPEPGAGDDLMPRFSPDGTRILFFRGTRSHREAWTVESSDGTTARAAGSPRGLVYGGAWLGPRGPLLVAADWFGLRQLNRLDLETGSAVPVGARGARFPDVDRAGNIVFENAVYSANLFRVDVADTTSAPRVLWSSTRYTNQAEFSPDGRQVAFTSNRDGVPALYVAPLDGEAKKVSQDDSYIIMRPHWSHDGRHVHATRVGRREGMPAVQQAVRYDPKDGTAEVLDALGDAVVDVRETDGGRALVVGEIAGNAIRLLRRGADGTMERLPLPLVSEYQVAGNRVAYMQPDLRGLTLCELRTMQCEPLPVTIDESSRYDWLLTTDAIWYRTATRPDAIARFDLAARRETWRGSFAPTAVGLSIAVSPDGRTLLVTREAPVAIDLLLAPRASR